MKTAVQLRASGALKCRTIAGVPVRTVRDPQGQVAIFGPGEIVTYVIEAGRLRHLFAFRTLAVDEPGSAAIIGVWPSVRLLFDLRTAGRIQKAERMFMYLSRIGRNPTKLSDGFYVRAGQILGGRQRERKILPELLYDEERRRS